MVFTVSSHHVAIGIVLILTHIMAFLIGFGFCDWGHKKF